MSSLPDRSESPRVPPPRRRATGMHPGWAAFMLAWFSGIFTMAAMLASVQWAAFRQPIGYVVFCGAVAAALFILGGRRAEKLWDRP